MPTIHICMNIGRYKRLLMHEYWKIKASTSNYVLSWEERMTKYIFSPAHVIRFHRIRRCTVGFGAHLKFCKRGPSDAATALRGCAGAMGPLNLEDVLQICGTAVLLGVPH